MIQYIASDIDGTLINYSVQSLDPVYFDLITRLKQKGIFFIAASGRQYTNLRRLFEPVKDSISYIAENGSLCIHNGQVIARGFISHELAFRVFDAAENFPGCNYYVSSEGYAYTASKDPVFIDHLENILDFKTRTIDNLKRISQPFIKIGICDFNGNERIESFFKEAFRNEIEVVTSGSIWIDFLAPNANKGTGLVHMCDYLGIDVKNGIVFGDQYNDRKMFDVAGTSYAMKNCAPGLEKYAHMQTDSVISVIEEVLNHS